MKLEKARLCIECDEVGEGYICPVCGSDQTWPIIRWLNYDPSEDSDNIQLKTIIAAYHKNDMDPWEAMEEVEKIVKERENQPCSSKLDQQPTTTQC